MEIDNAIVENYEKRIAAALREIDVLCTENSRIRLELMRAQAENARLRNALFPPQLEYKKMGGLKVYQ